MTVTLTCSAASSLDPITLSFTVATNAADFYDPYARRRARDPDPQAFAAEMREAHARRPVIRDQGPPPVRRQPAPRPMRPPPRRLAWLVEGRGR